ncbi:MAG TPA: iron-sulfur cluster assembly protein [Anaerolineales bacterium]|nr:iron-sulfur cluster assembly protein [Anaerolineales bacterium]
MIDSEGLRQAILERLSRVIDPETGADVIRMRLIEDLEIRPDGHVTYKFRPSSPLCPIAIPLSIAIKQAVDEVEGVTGQGLEIVGYAQAEEFTALFRQWLTGPDQPNGAHKQGK